MIRIQEFIQTLLLKKYGEKIWLERLFGKTPAKMKEKLINEFKEHNGTAVFILSPDVAGVGITLTEANNVVHLDRLWNPAKEDQATDRTYRIGQEKDVNVYLPITTLIDDKKTHIYEGQKEFIKRVYEKGEDQTVDEIIDGILKDKSNLAANFFGYIPQTSKNDQNVVLSKFAKRAEKKVEFDLETLPESLFLPLLGAYLIKTYGSKIMIGPEENDRGFNLIEKRNDQVLIYKMIDNVDELDSIKLKGESSDFADLLNVNPTIGVLSTSKSKKSFFKGLFDKTKDIEKLELPNIFTSDLVRHAVKLNALNRVEKIEHLAIDEPYKYTIILDGKKFYKSQPWKQLRYEVIAEFSNKHRNEGTKEACMACGQTGKEWHVDHIKPRSKYPHLALSIENLQVLCKNCNEGKSNLREDDFR